jgi:hypothetical protein
MTIQIQQEGNTAEQALTRTDVVRLLEEVGSPDQLDVSGQNLRRIDLLQFNLKGATMSHARIVHCLSRNLTLCSSRITLSSD